MLFLSLDMDGIVESTITNSLIVTRGYFSVIIAYLSPFQPSTHTPFDHPMSAFIRP